jgi:divalent metal cation (Fe/Co/Zn/Cd) transporter
MMIARGWHRGTEALRGLRGVNAVDGTIDSDGHQTVAHVQLDVGPDADLVAVCQAADQLMAQLRVDLDNKDLLFHVEVATHPAAAVPRSGPTAPELTSYA